MATIDSVKLPDNSTYDLTDNYSGYQKQTLATPIAVDGTSETTVEGALSGLNDYSNALKTAISNGNLLLNPFFTVNERGQASYSLHDDYTVNKWKMDYAGGEASVSVTANGLTLTGAYVYINQPLGSLTPLVGKTLTASILFSDNTIKTGTGTWASTDLTFVNDGGIILALSANNAVGFMVTNTSGNPVNIKAVKLELGERSTLANDIAPYYALELAKCQTSTADPSDTYANKGDIAVTSELSNRNLTINSWFTVNQRGYVSGATNANKYIFDMWQVANYTDANGTCALGSSGVTINNSASAGDSYLVQKFEDALDATRPYTASIKLGDGTIYKKTGLLPIAFEPIAGLSVTAYTDRYTIQVNGGVSSVTIRAIKLEVGSVSTLHLDVAPDYTTELLKCQRYFERVKLLGNGNSQSVIGIGYAASATVARMTIPAKGKRAAPTITFSGSFTLHDGSAVSAISYEEMTDNGIVVNVTSSGLTSGNVYLLRLGDTSYYIDFSADL